MIAKRVYHWLWGSSLPQRPFGIAPSASSITDEDISAGPTHPHVPTPITDITPLFAMGIMGTPNVQYLKWADELGIFRLAADRGAVTLAHIVDQTPLNARGCQAFVSVLCGLQVLRSVAPGSYALTDVAREYLDSRSPFYVGAALFGLLERPVPLAMVKRGPVRQASRTTERIRSLVNVNAWGHPERLATQHARNFPAAVVAARSGAFDGVTHLLDIGGGTGVFGIPLVLDRNDIKVTLAELPWALPEIEKVLKRHGVNRRITLTAFNAHHRPWPVRNFDGVLLGNFLHFCDDDEARNLLEEAWAGLPRGGRAFVHEMLWNADKEGPLLTSLWNFWVTNSSNGGQRTRAELAQLLGDAGFRDLVVTPTSGGFSLLVASK